MGRNPHHFVNIWEGRPFVHAWLGRVQRDLCVNSNKQSDHSPGGGAISHHVWMIPCILHLWALVLYVATTLSLVVVDGTCPTSLLWEVPSALFSFCLPMLYFYFVSVQATSELSPSPAKRKNNSLFVHPRNCICPLCTWKFKYTESSVTNWRGNVECTTYVFTPRPETPYQKDSMMVVMDWTLQTLEVIPMLLILAGDVETNPGPLELTVSNLSENLANVNDPIQLGTCLKIKMAVMDRIRRQYQDIDAQKREVFWVIENNQKRLGITWGKIADVVDKHLYMGDLADEIRSMTVENDVPLAEPFAGAATLPQEEMPTQRPQLGLEGDTATVETGVEDAATDEMRMDNSEDGSRLSSTSEPSDLESSSVQSSSGNSLFANSQSSYLRFECGCGKCSVLDYVSGKLCPNPKQLPFPKFGKCDVTPEVRVDIDVFEQKLFEKSRDMYLKFCDLLIDTFTALENSHHSLAKVKEHLEIVLRPKWFFPIVYAEDLNDIDSFSKLRGYIQIHYCSWLEYRIIEHLRAKFLFVTGNDEELANYENHFEEYVKDRCFIYLHDVGPWPRQQVEVKCKVDIIYLKLSYDLIRHLKLKFTEILGASRYLLTFKEAKEGCTELIFRAPPYFEKLTKLSRYQTRLLKEHGFIKVQIGDHILYQDSTSDLEDSGSVCSSEASSLDSISGHEGDVDTTDIDTTRAPLIEHPRSIYPWCEEELVLLKELDNDIRPCTLWDVHHNGQQCMAMCVSGPQDITDIVKCADSLLQASQKLNNVVQAKCIHYDTNISDHPIVVFESKRLFVDYCSSSLTPVLTEIDQLSFLLDIALGSISLQSSCPQHLIVTEASIFVQEEADGKMRALFCPLYGHSSLPQSTPDFNPSGDLKWISDTVALMHHRSKTDENIPESHILYNILHYKWLAKDEGRRPQSMVEVAKELEYILDLEKTRIGMINVLSSSDLLDVAHLHMLLIGHTGVGKTSIRKHLQNIPIDFNEKSTVIMEPELLCQETIEASTDSTSFVFKRNENVYKSEPDKIFLTLWDTGGQPMFQDLLPCFAKVRSIYGVVFRLTNLLDSSRAVIRPTCLLECERESPYTHREYIHRCLAFLNSFSFDMNQNFSNLPLEVKNVFETAEQSFPKVVLIGTHKDEVGKPEKLGLQEQYEQLRSNLRAGKLLDRAILPADNSDLFEIDNTRSGAKYEDPGMRDLRKQIVSCTQSAKAKIPREWISFKIDLERESRLQQPCTGIVTFDKAKEIALKFKIDAKVALSYFHELGIFLWYHQKPSLEEYIIIEPKNLLAVLARILAPSQFEIMPEEWGKLQASGVLKASVANQLLGANITGLPLSWVLAFLEEHHLAMPLSEGYFIPSMLQVVLICPNILHFHDLASDACADLSPTSKPEANPLFIVPTSKYIPPGFFPRLMTVLAGIQEGSSSWSLSPNRICKNMVSFNVNEQVCVTFTEYIDCVRVHCISLSDEKISETLCKEILSILKVQLQRVFPQPHKQPVSVTFACLCSIKSEHHFLPQLPLATDKEVSCSQYPNKSMKLTVAHKIWLGKHVSSEQDAKDLIEAALKEGSFNLRTTTVLFTGMPGSDVTSCKRTIVDNNTTPFESPHSLFNSTASLDSSFYVIKGECMKSFQPEDMDTLFANNAVLPLEIKNTAAASLSTESTEEDSLSTQPQVSEEKPSTPSHDARLKRAGDQHTDSSSNLSEDEESDEEQAKQTIQRHEPVSSMSLKKSADSSNIIELMQTATPEYRNLELVHCISCSNLILLEILPLFLQGISLGVVCIDLSQKLHDDVLIDRFRGIFGKQVASLSGMELIKHIYLLSAKVLVIGRHAEIESLESIETKSTILIGSSEKKLVLKGNEAIFELDPLSVREDDVDSALKQIVSLSSMTEPKTVALSWHLLGHRIQRVLREHNKKMISKQEVYVIAKEFHLSHFDLTAALVHLHELGLLFYYKDIIPDTIFGDFQLFVDIISDIESQTQSSAPVPVITQRNFQKVEGVYVDGLFTYKKAIELFKELHIVAELQNRTKFLLPCLLKENLSKEHLSTYCNDTTVAPLLIQYLMTPGIFGFLIGFLTSQHNTRLVPWRICMNRLGVEFSCIFKNCVQFTLPGFNSIITLFMTEKLLEVHVELLRLAPASIVAHVKEAVIEGLNKAYTALHYSGKADLVLGFNCPCKTVSHQHLVALYEQRWICSASLESTIIIHLTRTQAIWFSGTTDKDSLTVENAYIRLLPWSEKWFQIGEHLGLDTRDLQQISVIHRCDFEAALMEVTRRWFHNSRNPKWADVTEVMSSLQNTNFGKVLVFTIPVDHAGLVIGRDGRNIQAVERETGTIIKMERDYGMSSGNKRGVIYGSEENQKKALQLIINRLKKHISQQTAKAETIEIPDNKVGLVIGKGGQTINAIKSLSGVVDIKIEDRPTGLGAFSLFSSSTRKFVITGSEDEIEKAKKLIRLALLGGNIVVGATLAALIADLANLGVEVEESESSFSAHFVGDLDTVIKEVSDCIGLSWNFLARSVEFSETDIEAIVYANERNLREQIFQLFYQWKRRDGDNATVGKLIAALEDANLDHVLDKLEEKGLIQRTASHHTATDVNLMPNPQTPPRPVLQPTSLDTNVVLDGTVPAQAPQTPPNVTRITPNSSGTNDLNVEETQVEYLRRKGLERLASNTSSQSASSDTNPQDLQKQASVASNILNNEDNQETVSSSPALSPGASPQGICRYEVSDCIKVERRDAAPWYGVVKWIGGLTERPGMPVAGIEMESEVEGGCNGTKDGERLFRCPDKHGLFLPVSMLKKDDRFDPETENTSQNTSQSNFESNSQQHSSSTNQPRTLEDAFNRLVYNLDGPSSNEQAATSEASNSTTKVLVFTIPVDHAGLVIGRDGRNIQAVERETGTIIKMERDYGMASGNKRGVIYGSEENQKKALQLILNRLKKRISQQTAKAETIEIPDNKVGLVIGKGGQTINAIKSLSGVVDIKIDDRPTGLGAFSLFASSNRKCVITGSEDEIKKAKELIRLALLGGNIIVGATLAALIADLANLGVEVEESGT